MFVNFEKNVTYVSKTGLEMLNLNLKYKQIDIAAKGPKNEIKMSYQDKITYKSNNNSQFWPLLQMHRKNVLPVKKTGPFFYAT